MFTFLYPLLHFLQPGILWPALEPWRPMQIIGLLALMEALSQPAAYPRAQAFGHPAFKWLLAFVFTQGLSVWRGGGMAIIHEWIDWLHIPQYVIISLVVIRDLPSLERYLKGIVLGCLWVVGYGIYARYAGMLGHQYLAGAYGMYENHNDYSFIIIQTLPLLFFLRQRWGSLWPLVLNVGMLACVVGVLLSLSRGGIIALVIEACLVIFYGTSPKARRVLLPIALIVGLLGISYQYQHRAALGGSYTAEDAESSRFELWHAGRNMVLAHPILGVGSRRFREYAKYYYDLSHDQLGKNSHNTYIEVIATSGTLGFWCFLMMLRGVYVSFRDHRKARPPPLDSIASAGQVALMSILLRAFLDAKPHDWSLYLLLTLAVSVSVLGRCECPTDASRTSDRDTRING